MELSTKETDGEERREQQLRLVKHLESDDLDVNGYAVARGQDRGGESWSDAAHLQVAQGNEDQIVLYGVEESRNGEPQCVPPLADEAVPHPEVARIGPEAHAGCQLERE